jgi:hypothetical protein
MHARLWFAAPVVLGVDGSPCCRRAGSTSKFVWDAMTQRACADTSIHTLESTAGNTVERRHQTRGPQEEPSRARLVTMLEGTYREMPGLTLDLRHAARLLGLHDRTCEVVLDELVRRGKLRRTPSGQYCAG